MKKMYKSLNLNTILNISQVIIVLCTIALGIKVITEKNTIFSLKEFSKDKTPIVLEKLVYEDMTMSELSNKLNKSLKGILAGKGEIFAKYAIEYNIDPYLSLAIVLHETGCKWNCSYLATTCNNIGGQKGYPTCGNSSYKRFSTLDEGIKGFYDNLYYNYYSQGLTTVSSIHKKYAESSSWPYYVNNYINEIKNK